MPPPIDFRHILFVVCFCFSFKRLVYYTLLFAKSQGFLSKKSSFVKYHNQSHNFSGAIQHIIQLCKLISRETPRYPHTVWPGTSPEPQSLPQPLHETANGTWTSWWIHLSPCKTHYNFPYAPPTPTAYCKLQI